MDLKEIDAILNESREDDFSYDDINKDYGYDSYEPAEEPLQEQEEAADYSDKKLKEASQSVDAIYASFDKCKSQIDKAINAVLDVADALEDILVDATAVGGKIEEILPSHLESLISNLTNIAENELEKMKEGGQTSIESLKNLIGSIPYRDLKPETKEEKIAKISSRPNLTPNLSNGPRSSALKNESVEEDDKVLNFESLKESGYVGIDPKEDYRDDFRELNMGLSGGQLRESYQSPVDKGLDLGKLSLAPTSNGLDMKTMLNESASSSSEDMMAAFANADVNDSFAAIDVPKNLK